MQLRHFFCCGGKVNFVGILYNHDRFSKKSRTFFVIKLIPYKTYVREDPLFLALYVSYHINLYVKRFQYSICIRSIKTKTNTEISFSFWLTLFYCIPLLALLLYPSLSPYGRTDGQRVKYTPFAWAGGTCPRFAWAGGTFFPVVLLCQFLVLAGNRFWLYILLCTWSTIIVVVLC